MDEDEVHELVRKARQGDMAAFERLVDSRKERAIQTARTIVGDWEEARDVAQGAFLKVWQQLPAYDERYPFDVWLRRIVTNQAIDHYRRTRVRRDTAERASVEATPRRQTPHAPLAAREVRSLLEEAASGLPSRERAVFLMREVEELTPQEIAATLGITESTVRNHLFKARIALRKLIRDRYPEYGPRGGRGESGGGSPS